MKSVGQDEMFNNTHTHLSTEECKRCLWMNVRSVYGAINFFE